MVGDQVEVKGDVCSTEDPIEEHKGMDGDEWQFVRKEYDTHGGKAGVLQHSME